jgi:hypothetical protein
MNFRQHRESGEKIEASQHLAELEISDWEQQCRMRRENV